MRTKRSWIRTRATDVDGTPPVDGWPELDVPTDFDVTDGDCSGRTSARRRLPVYGVRDVSKHDTSDSCALCPGVACQSGAECNSADQQGGPASTHGTCVDGSNAMLLPGFSERGPDAI